MTSSSSIDATLTEVGYNDKFTSLWLHGTTDETSFRLRIPRRQGDEWQIGDKVRIVGLCGERIDFTIPGAGIERLSEPRKLTSTLRTLDKALEHCGQLSTVVIQFTEGESIVDGAKTRSILRSPVNCKQKSGWWKCSFLKTVAFNPPHHQTVLESTPQSTFTKVDGPLKEKEEKSILGESESPGIRCIQAIPLRFQRQKDQIWVETDVLGKISVNLPDHGDDDLWPILIKHEVPLDWQINEEDNVVGVSLRQIPSNRNRDEG